MLALRDQGHVTGAMQSSFILRLTVRMETEAQLEIVFESSEGQGTDQGSLWKCCLQSRLDKRRRRVGRAASPQSSESLLPSQSSKPMGFLEGMNWSSLS